MTLPVDTIGNHDGHFEDLPSAAATGLTRNRNTIDIPHRAVKRIACLGSGFVGGMMALLGNSCTLLLQADRHKALRPLS